MLNYVYHLASLSNLTYSILYPKWKPKHSKYIFYLYGAVYGEIRLMCDDVRVSFVTNESAMLNNIPTKRRSFVFTYDKIAVGCVTPWKDMRTNPVWKNSFILLSAPCILLFANKVAIRLLVISTKTWTRDRINRIMKVIGTACSSDPNTFYFLPHRRFRNWYKFQVSQLYFTFQQQLFICPNYIFTSRYSFTL